MTKLLDLCGQLEAIAPPMLAEEWDNTGLLMGDPEVEVTRVMTCLTITPESAAEAIDQRAELIISHHPLPFRPLSRLTTATPEGGMLWRLARAGVAIYSPHTSFDSAAAGINAALAAGIGVVDAEPLSPRVDQPEIGAGRVGNLNAPTPLDTLAVRAKVFLKADSVRVVGAPETQIHRVAVGCGSGGSFISVARQHGADALLTGEATFHNCLAAKAVGLALILPGHYASERFALEQLAEKLAQTNPALHVWASRAECDPLRTL